MSRAPFDLGYTHEMAAATVSMTVTPCPGRAAARDLTARLRCLKALMEAERNARLGLGSTARARPGRKRAH